MSCELDQAIAVRLSGITKKYRLFKSQSDRLLEALWPRRKRHEDFWALQGIDLEIRKGETFGILGRNGSGKSTLLQIIAGVLQPTSGKISVAGRISALLELGAGFNPEFSGRENVVLNGSFMGVDPREMHERLPAIEAFADIGQFFDQPVKTYSSGMFVRVAFAAAINVDPDILLVDEALSVGDIRFQRKCFAQIDHLKKLNTTIIFVTHDIHSIAKHCDNAIIVDSGRIVAHDHPRMTIPRYMTLLHDVPINSHGHGDRKTQRATDDPAQASNKLLEFTQQKDTGDKAHDKACYNPSEYRVGIGKAKIIDFLLSSDGVINPQTIRNSTKLSLYIKAHYLCDIDHPTFGFAINTADGLVLYGTNTFMLNKELPPAKADEVRVVRFEFTISFAPMAIFIDLGCGHLCPEGMVPLDRRHNVIHVTATAAAAHSGLFDTKCSFTMLNTHSTAQQSNNV